MNKACIYAIWFPSASDNSVYVGQTRRGVRVRETDHRGNLSRGVKWSFKLYNWMRERIESGHEPEFLLLEECSAEELNRKEDEWQAWFKDLGWISKHVKGGESQGGYKLTEEHKAKLSAAKKGKPRPPMSEETKRKIGDKNRGIKRTPEFIEQMRQVRLGRGQIPEHVAKRMATIMSKPPEVRAEQYRKMAAKNTGSKRTPETRGRMRLAQLGKKATLETREKSSIQRAGKPWSETRRKRFEERKDAARNSQGNSRQHLPSGG